MCKDFGFPTIQINQFWSPFHFANSSSSALRQLSEFAPSADLTVGNQISEIS